VTVALRTPWDLAAYPQVRTHACTYSILPESMDALAAALFGRPTAVSTRGGGGGGGGGGSGFPGHLPVSIEGLAERGHGLTPRPASVA
jgi:beta-N-acetylhexosaminidase